MGKIVKGFLIDVHEPKKSNVVVFNDTLENIYEMLNVELIDVAERQIGKHTYDIVCDDEGLLKPNYPSAFDTKGKVQFVGSLLLVNHDDEGNFASLTEEQVQEIKENFRVCVVSNDEGKPRAYGVLINVEYVGYSA